MALILHLETATKMCSVSLANNGQEILTKEFSSEQFSHAEKLNVFIQEIFQESNYSISQLNAVAVSEGPGSYTGLRIGTSSAKGICYALDIPLIAINSLAALAASCKKEKGDSFVCSLFDAMRLEVYAAIFDSSGTIIFPTAAVILDENSFHEFLEKNKILFVGPGAAKAQEIILHTNATFNLDISVSARGMIDLAHKKFMANDFVDLAYFEPFYLKDFIAGEKKKIF